MDAKRKTPKQEFDEQCDRMKSYSGALTSDDRLKLYGLFKQATVGDNTSSRPFALNLEGAAKWDAWETRKGVDKDVAMRQYVNCAKKFK